MDKKPSSCFCIVPAVLALLAVFAFLAYPLVSEAIGQITEPIVITDVLRGQEITKKMTLINSAAAKIIFQIKAEGDIKDWVTFYNLNDLQAPVTEVEIAPVFYHDVSAVFKIPADLPNGTYKGTLDAIVVPEKNTSDQTVSVSMKVSRSVTIIVSDKEVINIEAFFSPVSYIVKAGDPAQIRVVYDNKGNIAVKSDVQLKVFNKDNKVVYNAILPYADGAAPVKAGERKEMPLIEWQTAGQPLGDYIAEATPVVAGQTFKTQQITFTIKNLDVAGLAGISKMSGFNKWVAIGGLVLFILIILAVFMLRRGKAVRI